MVPIVANFPLAIRDQLESRNRKQSGRVRAVVVEVDCLATSYLDTNSGG